MQRTLCVLFKLIGQHKVATLASGESIEMRHDYIDATLPTLSPCTSWIKEINVNIWLIQAAAVIVLSQSYATGTAATSSLPLIAANNTTITTYGTCKGVVDVGLKRDYTWTFIVADIKQPILGADFFIHYNILVDLQGRCLRNMKTGWLYMPPYRQSSCYQLTA